LALEQFKTAGWAIFLHAQKFLESLTVLNDLLVNLNMLLIILRILNAFGLSAFNSSIHVLKLGHLDLKRLYQVHDIEWKENTWDLGWWFPWGAVYNLHLK